MDTIIDLNGANGESPNLRSLARRSLRVLLEPARFFRVDFTRMPGSSLLAFGVGNAWAASAVAFCVQTFNSLLVARLLDRWMQRLIPSEDGFTVFGASASQFLYSAGSILLGPFLYLLQVGLGGFAIFVFSRLLIDDRAEAPEPVTFGTSARIRATALVAEWYTLVPVFGGVLAFFATLVLTITGVRERYGVSTRRAVAVVLAPYVLMLVMASLLAALFVLALSQMPAQDLLDLDLQQFGF